MKKLMITISDLEGTKQYTLHQLVRRLAPWIGGSIITVVAISFLLFKVYLV